MSTPQLSLRNGPSGARPQPLVRPVHISGYAREEHDFYPTPGWVTECLLRRVPLRGPVWEPCCGDGAVARVLAAHGHEVVATDLDDRGFGEAGVDFLACTQFPAGCRALVTNPPYGDGSTKRNAPSAPRLLLGFVRHAIDLAVRAEGQLALLLRFQWIAGKRASELISSGPLDTVLVLTERIRWFDMGAATKQGQHHHCWLFFDARRDRSGPPQIVFGN